MKKLRVDLWLFWLWLFVLGTLIVSGGCKKDRDEPTPAGNSSVMNVRLSNTAGPYDAVVVNIIDVKVHIEGQGWISMPNARKGFYNLLDFTNGHDTLLAGGSIPSGKVSQIRLYLGSGNYVVINGIQYSMATPSAEESGLKININQHVQAGNTYTLWLDFDVSKSIVFQGSGAYALKPVIRGFLLSNTGSISGDVDPDAAADYVFTAQTSGGDTSAAYPRTDGYFKISGLAPGTYYVTFIKAGTVVKVVNPVTVTANTENSLGVVNIP